MENNHRHITPYGTYLFILLCLIAFTIVSVYVTTIELGAWSVFTALALATIKSLLVLLWFMHVKLDKLYLKFFIALVFAVYIAIIIVTFFDYSYR
jgi:cytochrome c oxidase subunit IV